MSFGFGKSSGPSNPPEANPFLSNNNPAPRFPTPSGIRGSSVQWPQAPPPTTVGGFGTDAMNDNLRNSLGSGSPVQWGQTLATGRGFGGQKSPNTPHSYQNLGRSRPAPVQYTDEFLSNPMEGNSPVQRGLNFTNVSFGGRSFPNVLDDSQGLEKSRPPPVQYTDDFLSNPVESNPDVASNHHGHLALQRRLSPSGVASNNSITPTASWNKYQRPVLQSHTWIAPARPDNGNTSPLNERSISSNNIVGTWKPKERSPEDGMKKGSEASLDVSRRPSVSPPNSRSKSGVLGTTDFQLSQRIVASAGKTNDDSRVIKLESQSVNKRSRSPSASAGQTFQINSQTADNDAEREEQAKAKRLARFRTELDRVEPSDSNLDGTSATQKENSVMKTNSPAVVKKFSGYCPSGPMEDSSQDVDNEVLQSNSVIVGLCPDMCPESERGERERKGDLDQYERLDGDRNQTSKIIAVKKYTRTAEREAKLIRPMPILQKTMDYLLGLLDQPYDARFLGLYNFLWDRMRAIRMDLRMQHIFDHKAITLLEQMIRLHLIAMHELCEFPKGEGFSEGFDAHLNIEQMNKTSVELFQLYDDHRKKGILIPTEKEFRGYYALLKLDKHPGYKVEPAELSLDLAKMTPEIRQTEEVLFARDVARSCRTGNFIAFFRSARKASYHQACLMHAHFSKLRTQALASLHSGLQYNQGLPLTDVAKWLGMEGEDIEGLLEYHGFIIKDFEEPYMVKDGAFLNDEKDYATRCSILVHGKKSNTIVEDVLSSHAVVLPFDSKMELQSKKNDKSKCAVGKPVRTETPLDTSVDREMKIKAVSSQTSSTQVQSAHETSSGVQVQPLPESNFGQYFTGRQKVSASSPRSSTKVLKAFANLGEQSSPKTPKCSPLVVDNVQVNSKPWNSFAVQSVPAPQPPSLGFARQDALGGPIQAASEIMVNSGFNATLAPIVSTDVQESIPSDSKTASGSETPPHDNVLKEESSRQGVTDVQETVEGDDVFSNYDEEVAEAKLRLLLRLWRRRFVRKKKMREQNKLEAIAALSSLSLGPPIRKNKDNPVPSRRLSIDKALRERYGKRRQSWERWNVSDVVATNFAESNSDSNCVCWKVVSFSCLHHGTNDIEARSSMTHPYLDEWLRYKLFPDEKDGVLEGLTLSAPGLSVWTKWSHNHSGDLTCYFSIIKAAESGNFEKNLSGASAMLFPVFNTIPWDHQKAQLQNLVRSLPSRASIPLLIMSASGENNSTEVFSTVAYKLGLEALDKSRISSFLVVYLTEREESEQLHGYYSDERLKEGMMWLASKSRPQPVLSCVPTRELVSVHLNVRVDGLDLMGPDKVGPNQCISAFNEALDQSVINITTACDANPTGWPCPELFLLDDSTAEFRAVKQFFPSLGWSSSEEVEPFLSALRNSKLPYMHEDLSWLSKGCSTQKDLDDQRQFLQDCLIRYLTQSSNVMYGMMAEKEASLMVQNCTRLELHDTEYKVVPSWIRIFRRVFNWQLNSLTCFSSKVYVLEQSLSVSRSRLVDMPEVECPTPLYAAHPTLDEMVEVSCSPASKRVRSSPRNMHNVPSITYGDNTSAVTAFNHPVEEADPDVAAREVPGSDLMKRVTQADSPCEKRDDDKLVKLLEQCNMLQDAIEKKLSFYF